MTKFSKSQKKGKISIYNSRFLKRKKELDSYSKIDFAEDHKILKFINSTKSNSITAVVCNLKTNEKYLYPAPEKVKIGTIINKSEDSIVLKSLKAYTLGQRVCAVELYQNQNKYLCSAAGTFATIYAHNEDSKTTILLVKKRKIVLPWTNKAMAGTISNSNFNLKPIYKAGIASKISYAKGKKYPNVSEHKKNVLDSCIGGSYRKSKRIKCVRHDTNPKRKTGHISPSRTGKKKSKS